MACVTIGIMFYYAVVAGWCIRYFVVSSTGAVQPGIDGQAYWDAFIGDPVQTVGYHAAAVALLRRRRLQGDQGRARAGAQDLPPALLVILVILAFRAVTLPGAELGLRYLFIPDWSLL
jgi:neurotransmitter:Na+ symporter, NSS family